VELLGKVGLEGARVVRRLDTFRGTTKERVAARYGVRGANVYARKPGGPT
jgi:hypothetical protein